MKIILGTYTIAIMVVVRGGVGGLYCLSDVQIFSPLCRFTAHLLLVQRVSWECSIGNWSCGGLLRSRRWSILSDHLRPVCQLLWYVHRAESVFFLYVMLECI